jgi:hypothetical protein
MKRLFLFFIFLTFLISSCSDKEHTIERGSLWMQTIGETTHQFQFYTKMSWAGKEGKKYLMEHEIGDCTYWTHLKGEDELVYWATSYHYERNRNSITLKEWNNPETAPIWLQGHIENDIMFLKNDVLTFELQKIGSFEDIH